MNIINMVENNNAIIVIVLAAMTLLLLILLIITMIRLGGLNKKYIKFMSGANGENLEKQVLSRFADVDVLKKDNKLMHTEIDKIKENLLVTYQKIGVVKYDAFKEMGGKLSFVLALLDKNNNGILLNSVHSSREGCYTYIKEIIKGESFLELSADEKAALDMAINSNNFME
jgi:hypothetical protein